MVSGSYELPLIRPALLDVGAEATGDTSLPTVKWLGESSKLHLLITVGDYHVANRASTDIYVSTQ